MLTANLTGALLDHWTARAEGIPAADLEFRGQGTLCVRNLRGTPGNIAAVMVMDYSTNWALCGPLVEKHLADVDCFVDPVRWICDIVTERGIGPTPLIAICRAVVRAAFGDEVEDLP